MNIQQYADYEKKLKDMSKEVATCRGCGRKLNGKPYYAGHTAYIPETNERAKVNHYGGFVCSERCDIKSSVELEVTMPGCNTIKGFNNLSTYAQQSIKRNWQN